MTKKQKQIDEHHGIGGSYLREKPGTARTLKHRTAPISLGKLAKEEEAGYNNKKTAKKE